MNFGETVVAAALGASIPGVVLWSVKTWATSRWKRKTPAGQGYARLEGVVEEILKRTPSPKKKDSA